jgi:hypothetical protein
MLLRDVAADKHQPLLLLFEDDEVFYETGIFVEAILSILRHPGINAGTCSIISLKALRCIKSGKERRMS